MENKSYVGLFVPGHRPGELEKAFRMAVPSLTIDLCKTVPEQDRCAAIYLVAEALKEFENRGKRNVLWISVERKEIMKKELEILLKNRIDQIRISSVRSSEELQEIEIILEESTSDSFIPGIELVVDDINVLIKLKKLCESAKYLKSLTIGVFDTKKSLPITERTTDNLCKIKREVVRIAKDYNLLPIDSVCVNYSDMNKLEKDCYTSKQMGFLGRSVIHPSQIKTCINIYNGGV